MKLERARLDVRPLRQDGELWSPLLLGDSSKTTIGHAGCLLMALREAGLRLCGYDVPPARLNAAGRQRAGFALGTGNAKIDKLAPIVGLVQGTRTAGRVGERSLRDAVHEALVDGVALLHVDRDKSVPDDDPKGKHWVCALALEPPIDDIGHASIVCTDSATGDFVRLDAETLDGVAHWGEGDWRRYAVREVVPLRRAPMPAA